MKSLVLVIAAMGVLAFAQAAGASNVRTDMAPQFAIGDSVCFKWVNDDTMYVCGLGLPPYSIYDSSGKLAGSCGYYAVVWPLLPGESERFCWMQKDCAGNQVPAGSYKVRISYGADGCTYPAAVYQTFVISEPSSVIERTWGIIKALYR